VLVVVCWCRKVLRSASNKSYGCEWRVGDPLDKAIDIGAIVAPVQLQRIEKLVEQGKAEGATCWQPSWAVP